MQLTHLMKRAAVFVVALALSSSPAQAQFGMFKVRGIVIEAPPTRLYDNPSVLGGENLCAAVDGYRGRIMALYNGFIGDVNAFLHSRVKGVALVRHRLDLSPNCHGLASLTNGEGALLVTLDLPANRFVTNVTTPTLLGQYADPRLSFTFDVEVNILIPLPQRAGECLGAPVAKVGFRNISLPKGLNMPGKIVEAGVDITTSVYDQFFNGKLGGTLTAGVDWGGALPGGLVADLDRHLCHGATYRSIRAGYATGDQLKISLGTGARIEDARCIPGYVWRAVRANDLVCVTPETRAEIRRDNAASAARTVQPAVPDPMMLCLPGACRRQHPPRPCLPGYVWREAVADDDVCVAPETRAKAREDNRMAAHRRLDYEPVIH